MQQETISVNGFGFECLVAGEEGQPLVIMMHNFLQTNQQWRQQIPVLAKNGYRVLAPNMRGVSPQARPEQSSAYSNDEMIGDVLALAEHEGVEAFHLVTHGWSSLIGWNLAENNAEALLSFTALSTPHPIALSKTVGDEQAMLDKIASFCSDNASVRLLANNAEILRTYYQSYGVEDDIADLYLSRYGRAEAIQGFVHWHSMQSDELAESLQPVQVPTLYIRGSEDSFFGEKAAALCADGVDAPYAYVLIDGAGHMLGEQVADRLTDELLCHLNKLKAAA
ncbi:Epoxide hydrolase A [Sinobacterium norvegicum]|uniref:Epoxide hydrolase A n=1 Tax=Sinobacterium norvegicum TaxID=1641715 RepID=A0ABM9ACV6_9GAMM|nr:alpha/beta hydrolase [Sinobacterium norvegicum]CAH0990777.1 Epoxide hydrolase A [Sinobacterium norvegicum]